MGSDLVSTSHSTSIVNRNKSPLITRGLLFFLFLSNPSILILSPGKIQVGNSKVFAKLGNGTVRDLTLDTDTNTVYTHPYDIQCNAINEINSLKSSVSNGKSAIASAITGKGVSTAADATFQTMANNINQIYVPDSRLVLTNDTLTMGAASSYDFSWSLVSCTGADGVIGYQGPNKQYFYEGRADTAISGIGTWCCGLGGGNGLTYAHTIIDIYATIVYSPPFSGIMNFSLKVSKNYVSASIISAYVNGDSYYVILRVLPVSNTYVTWSFSQIDLTVSVRYTNNITVFTTEHSIGVIPGVP